MLRLACVRVLLPPDPTEPDLAPRGRTRHPSGSPPSRLETELHRFSPAIERSILLPGVYWLRPPLESRLEEWGAALAENISKQFSAASIVIGFTRFGGFVVSSCRDNLLVIQSHQQERTLVHRAPLRSIASDNFPILEFDKLGVFTVGDYLCLPSSGIRERYGEEAALIHRMFHDDLAMPRESVPEPLPLECRIILDQAESDSTRLLFHVKNMLDRLLEDLVARGHALIALYVTFTLENSSVISFDLRPARETLNSVFILDLLRLQMEHASLSGGFSDDIEEIHLLVDSVPATSEQRELFHEEHARDGRAATDALDRIRAEYGADTVTSLRLKDAHLPEARFSFSVTENSLNAGASLRYRKNAKSSPVCPANSLAAPQLVRHIHTKPREFFRAQCRLTGPHIISGGWWMKDVHREYYLAETDNDLLWIYYDKKRGKWFAQ